jgi:hypothetical protein
VLRKGYVQITGLAWSGGGVVGKVDISTDGGKTWKEAKLQSPVVPKAHTRFTFDWAWDGEEAVIVSRCTDELGEVQPSRKELPHRGGGGETQPRHSFQRHAALESRPRRQRARRDVLVACVAIRFM